MENPELGQREVNRNTVNFNEVFARIYSDSVNFYLVGFARDCRRIAPQDCSDTRHKDFGTKGLSYIIIGAELQTDQAEADKRIAQAKAEERRAMAVAAEQEMRAKVQEMRARVVEAEAQIPLAIAEAFRSGNLGIMDYMRYRNIAADTEMRHAIAGGTPDAPPEVG